MNAIAVEPPKHQAITQHSEFVALPEDPAQASAATKAQLLQVLANPHAGGAKESSVILYSHFGSAPLSALSLDCAFHGEASSQKTFVIGVGPAHCMIEMAASEQLSERLCPLSFAKVWYDGKNTIEVGLGSQSPEEAGLRKMIDFLQSVFPTMTVTDTTPAAAVEFYGTRVPKLTHW